MAQNVASPPFTLARSEPTLKDVLDLLKKDILLSLNAHAIATVQSFNASNQTVNATVNYQHTYRVLDENTGNYQSTLVSYPQLVDIPVVILGGEDSFLTFPIEQGDECVVLFNDRDIDNWFAGSSSNGPNTGRLHSFSDGIALIGLRNKGRLLQSYDTERVVLQKGDALVAVGKDDSLVKIANQQTTLNTLLQDLVTTIKNITTSNAVVGVPCTISPASQVQLSNIATQIEGLLE